MAERTFKRLLGYQISQFVFRFTTQGLNDLIQSVKDIDAAQVRLARVTDLSGSSMDEFTKKAFAAGRQIGRTGQDVLDATTELRRAGFELKEAFEMGQIALKMVNIGDGVKSVEDATSSLIAVLRGFNKEASESASVIDMINEVSNKAPIDFANITEGLTRTSGTLSQTGVEIEQLIGLLTGGFASLRNVETVSSGLIMISQRLRGIGEDGEAIDGLAPKIEKAFKEIAGIDISDGVGGLRDTYSILEDMHSIFPTLTDQQRQYLSELAASNRNVKVLNAILSNWSDVEGAIQSATESMGSADRENAKYLDSIEGRTQQMKSSFQDLANSLVDNSWIKGLITIGDEALKLFGAFDGALAKLVAAPVAIITAFGALKTIGKMDLFQNIGGAFQSLGGCKILHSVRILPYVS